ncbi:glutathione reductase (NADPH) [Weissella uvarum]|uniref:dihydrolipoyl dehydrogenase family protein n=1 Tax=Weissella uvarum TaxID=1479233 RepID=UPI00195F5AAB|nr:NAD(P)/FAD-dependent oxidoreductase [Weissella uvarum]MBM7617006.1 glutathione reductase (NADPH) [Weissella uvarum]MCM0595304.1 NAD(P)/FAD-dependent oxidoreductase [Weissella uvarum]
MDFDVLYIGSGQATWNGAVPLAQAGVNVAVVEEALFGGICSNYGCNAKIALDYPVELTRQVEAMQDHGVTGDIEIDWADAMAHKHELIDPQSQHNEDRLTNAGIKVIKGHATFVDQHTISVSGQTITADKIVIATGQRPHRLEIEGAEYVHDSTDFLSIPEMPEHVTIFGGGFIALEFATIANAAGAKVDVITRSNTYLRSFPQKYVKLVVADLKQRGVRFIPSQEITSVEAISDLAGYDEFVVYGQNGLELTTDYVLDATGRIPNHDELNLAAVGVATTDRGILVNEYLQTNVDNIYAAGDVVDHDLPKITPVAAFESRYLAARFMGKSDAPIDYPAISTVAFTSPRIAQVGISVAEAAEHPDLYRVEDVDYQSDWFRQVGNETQAYLTLIFNQNDVLVGAAEMSHEAVNSINTFVPMIEMQLNRTQLQRFIYLFPSIEYTGQRRL